MLRSFRGKPGTLFDFLARLGGKRTNIARQCRQIQFLFGFEIEVYRAFANAGFGRDIVHRSCRVALARKNRTGGVQNGIALTSGD